jgi:hypothetical protein
MEEMSTGAGHEAGHFTTQLKEKKKQDDEDKEGKQPTPAATLVRCAWLLVPQVAHMGRPPPPLSTRGLTRVACPLPLRASATHGPSSTGGHPPPLR